MQKTKKDMVRELLTCVEADMVELEIFFTKSNRLIINGMLTTNMVKTRKCS